jgi:molybdate transport system ATP-binding protein
VDVRRRRIVTTEHVHGTGEGLDARVVVRRGAFELDVSLSIEAGSTAALLGPNGAGKSTTIDALVGLASLEPPGHVRLAGRTLDDPDRGVFVPPEHRRIGVVFQDRRLFDHMSVRENVAFGPRATGRGRAASRAAADEWLTTLHLRDLADRRPSELSGGQAQRVALARALASSPELLLFDEPLTALDVETRRELRRALNDHLAGFDGPRLLITHEPADAFLLADTVHVLEDGRITQSGTPDEIRRHPATAYIAALAGTNLFIGRASAGSVMLDAYEHVFTVADTSVEGPVVLTVHPRAISLHTSRPEGSPRNTWASVVDLVESMGDTVRITLADPVPAAVDITPDAVASLALAPGVPVWAAVKATEITVSSM